jgi:hypothetical protein
MSKNLFEIHKVFKTFEKTGREPNFIMSQVLWGKASMPTYTIDLSKNLSELNYSK